MIVDGINRNTANNTGSMGTNEEAAIQKKIQMLKKQLGDLVKKDELSKEEAKKKKELEQEIDKLEQKLQQIDTEKEEEKQDENEDNFVKLKEAGKGENIDERV
ncbi:MAG: FlxA-like family protein [Lachnospiraceae bacterium]|nr:FlxA-like family protein [Lachnospiraceae bacterium]